MKEQINLKSQDGKAVLDLNMTMFFATGKTGLMEQYFYSIDQLNETEVTINEDVCHNEAFDINSPCYNNQEKLYGGSINNVSVSISQNTASLKSCNIIDFSPIEDIDGNAITIKCNNKQAPANYTMEDLYSPNNVYQNGQWINTNLKTIFVKLIGFEIPADQYITELGYQIAIDEAPQPNGILTLIGTGYNGLLGDNLSCKSPLNAISLFNITIESGKKLYLNLRNESGEDMYVNVVIKDQNGVIINWLDNKQILSSYVATTPSPFVFDLSTLNVDNNCYTIEITRGEGVPPIPECCSMDMSNGRSHIGSSYGQPVKFPSGVTSQYFDFVQVDGTKSCLRCKVSGTYNVSGSVYFQSTNVGELVTGEIYHYLNESNKYDSSTFNNMSSGSTYLQSTITVNVGDEIYLYAKWTSGGFGGFDITGYSQVIACPV